MFEERGAASERKLARLAAARSASPWNLSLANRQKKGPVPRRVVAGTGPEGYRYAAARRTGIPILRALSTRLLVMPDPGKARTPFGRKLSSTSLRRKGAALPSRPQSGLHTTWWTPFFSAQLAAIFSAPGPPPCSRTMSSYLILMLSRECQMAVTSPKGSVAKSGYLVTCLCDLPRGVEA